MPPENVSGPRDLGVLVAGALRHLETLNYSKMTVRNYGTTWRSYVRFAAGHGIIDRFSNEIADKFLASRGVPLAGPALASNARHLRAAMRILSEFEYSGCFSRRQGTAEVDCSQPAMKAALDMYNKHCVNHRKLASQTMHGRVRRVARFLQFLEARGHVVPDTLRPADIEIYARTRGHLQQATICGEMSSLRSFIRVGFALGLLPQDLSEHVPRVPTRRYGRIPSTWKPDDVDAMLGTVDRASPVGKRDYVLLLLACRLGLRIGDIKSLQLDDLDWDQATITLQQSKTRTMLQLPMTDEVATALIEYLRHGRPAVEHREIFVRLKAPFAPYVDKNNFHSTITKYRRLAGIELEPGALRGLHSLRHSLATALLADGVPVEQIGPILGHASIDTTRIYTRVDIAALRSAALDPDGGDDA